MQTTQKTSTTQSPIALSFLTLHCTQCSFSPSLAIILCLPRSYTKRYTHDAQPTSDRKKKDMYHSDDRSIASSKMQTAEGEFTLSQSRNGP